MLCSFSLPQGWGSGAGDSDVWHEVFARHNASSSGLLVDRYATVAAQTKMLTQLQLVGQYQTMGPHLAPLRLAADVPLIFTVRPRGGN